jgi:hypothetical protein
MLTARVRTTVAACLLLAGLAGAATPSGSTATREEVRLADLDLGEHWFGPEITVDSLQGKVVLFEMWGS